MDRLPHIELQGQPVASAAAPAPLRISGVAHAPVVEPSSEPAPALVPAAPYDLPPVASARSRLLSLPTGRWIQVGYALIDIAFVLFSAAITFSFYFLWEVGTLQWLAPEEVVGEFPGNQYLAFLLLYAALVLLSCQAHDLYRTPRGRTALDESLSVVRAVLLATLLLTGFIFLFGAHPVSRIVVFLTTALSLVALVTWRFAKRRWVERRTAAGIGTRNVLIVGAGKIGRTLAHHFATNPQLGYQVKGFIDPHHSSDPRMLGTLDDLGRVARKHFIDEVFITIPSEREIVKRLAVEARRRNLDVKVVPDLYDGLGWSAPMHHLGGLPVMELYRKPIPALGLLFKRALDIVGGLCALILLSPLMALVALAIKLDSRGPVFYRSPRVGRKGRIFRCYKFRTMVPNADELKAELRRRNERNGPFFKIAADPRLTRLGGFLRKSSLDELPQLWNVLRGEMSLVGPRPHPLDDYQQYTLEHLRRLDVKPGLTGLWQVTARRDPSFETNMTLDLAYIENWDIWTDFKLILRTVPAVLRGQGQ